MLEHVLGQKYGEIFPRHVLDDGAQDPKPRFLSPPEQNNHPNHEGRADGGGRARPGAALGENGDCAVALWRERSRASGMTDAV